MMVITAPVIYSVHAIRVRTTHEHYRTFVDYGDAEAYRERLDELRRALEKLKRERPVDPANSGWTSRRLHRRGASWSGSSSRIEEI
jgi:hypothetical protein